MRDMVDREADEVYGERKIREGAELSISRRPRPVDACLHSAFHRLRIAMSIRRRQDVREMGRAGDGDRRVEAFAVSSANSLPVVPM